MAFEEELRQSLRRDAAPPGFAAQVMARAHRLDGARVVVMPLWRRPLTWAVAAGLAVAAIIPLGIQEQHRRTEARRLEARRQLVIALNITRVQLQKTRDRLQKVNRHAL